MAVQFIAGIFLILHGLVHLLYYGQSARRFELAPGLTWPDGSWTFSRLIGDPASRKLAGACCILAAASFLVSGVGLILDQSWWRGMAAASAAFSAVFYILFWNGRRERLANQGAVGILIDIAVLAAALWLGWP